LRGVVDFVVVLLKVPKEVFGTQAVSTRFIALLVWLRVWWSCWCLHPDIVIALTGIACMLTYSWGGCR
jgi:hypothetical protein